MDEKKRKKLNKELKKFIFAKATELATRASMGWIYALSYDKAFLIENLGLKETYKTNLKKKNKYLKQKNSKMDFDIFDQLQRLDRVHITDWVFQAFGGVGFDRVYHRIDTGFSGDVARQT